MSQGSYICARACSSDLYCHTSADEMWDCVEYILIPPVARLPAQHGPGRYTGPGTCCSH